MDDAKAIVPAGRTYDLLVIGGGVNGAAIARDAALRGLTVCLVEAHDWGGGTSAKSSKLAHGGLRYLEQFEFALVHEALRDRERLLRQAPHLVKPLRFVYPLYPDTAGRWTVRTGLWLYDLLSRGKSLPNRRFVGRSEALRLVPGLTPARLAGAATFHDAQIVLAERLVLEMVLQARSHGADVHNYARVDHLTFETGPDGTHVTGAMVEMEDGKLHALRSRATVNAAGCWVDDVLGPLGEGKPPKVRMTKGAHLVVPRFLEHAVMVRAKDGRTFFILPWQTHCVIGTTDTDYHGDARNAVADPDDVRYLIESAQRFFPGAPIPDVTYTYAGVRALVNQPGVSESNVTRRHILYDHARRDGVANLWTLQGGKITTARTLAEECVDRVARALGRRDLALHHPTRQTHLPGGPDQAWGPFREAAVAAAISRGVTPHAAEALVDRHGAQYEAVLAADARPEALATVPGHPDVLWCEVTHAVVNEMARHVGDVLLRRTQMGLAAQGLPAAERTTAAVAQWMAALLGWTAPRVERELAAYRAERQQFQVPQ